MTFNERVRTFWSWFTEVAPRFYATIEAGNCPDLAAEVSARTDELLPGFGWCFGPGPEQVGGHSFTLSGEGMLGRQLLALQWHALAPEIEGWTFFPFRQPGPIAGHVIEFDGERFDPAAIWITAHLDEEDENVDIVAWHPAWKGRERNECLRVLFLFLDEALGEYGTEWWIGEIEIADTQLAHAFPLEELSQFVAEATQKCGWEKHPPGESYSLASFPEDPGSYPRGDVRTQTTAMWPIIRDFHEAGGELPDPLEGTGADFIYVSIDIAHFPAGEQIETRSGLEEALDQALQSAASGRCLGGALGLERGYIDLLVYDGPRSLELVRQTLQSSHLPPGTMIEFFAHEKRTQRVAL